MKTIPDNAENAQWSNKLLNDLAFIKKHRRHPLSKKMILPSFSLLFIIVIGLRTIFITFFIQNKNISIMLWAAVTLIALSISGIIYSYLSIIRFTSISTPYFVQENIRLVEEFLRSQQLNVYRHPNAPEVLQILSRPLGDRAEQREAMVFVADDKCILINSHFINQRCTIAPQSRNYRKMANRLREWLKIYYPKTNTIITVG